MLPILTERLVLRRLAVSDLAAFQACRTDPDVARYQGWEPTDDETARAFLAEMAVAEAFPRGDWFQLAMAKAADDELIGDIGVCLTADGDEAEIGFSLARAYQGQGYGREAIAALIAHLPCRRIVAITDSRNRPSIRLIEAVGLRLAHRIDTVFRGEPCTELVYHLDRP